VNVNPWNFAMLANGGECPGEIYDESVVEGVAAEGSCVNEGYSSSYGCYGGAVYVGAGGTVTIEHSTFSSCSSSNKGGFAFVSDGGVLSVLQSWVVSNTADDSGGGLLFSFPFTNSHTYMRILHVNPCCTQYLHID